MLPEGFRRLVRLPANPTRVARDVDDEIAFHLAMREERLRAAGLSAEEARLAARRRFGDVGRVTDECLAIDIEHARVRRRTEVLGSAWQDARYAARSLARAPAFAASALLTLALGIGATTAVFSVVYGVLLRPLPYAAPERLVQLWETSTRTPGDRNPLSVPNYLDWAARSRSLASSVAYAFNRFTVTGEGTPEQIQGAQILGDLSGVLGVRPILGRGITREDERAYTVVLSEGLWRRRYGADLAIIGRTIRMSGQPYAIVGVMPAAFRFPRPDVELWTGYATILTRPEWSEQRGRRFQRAVARVRPGVSAAAASSELDGIARQLAAEYPEQNPGAGAVAVPLHEQMVGDVRPALLVLMGAVACVLLIAAANVAHLLLARTTARERELSVRAALGAGRARVVQQLLTESLVLAAIGGASGVALAHLGVVGLRALDPEAIPRLDDVRVDAWALAFAAAAVVVTGTLVGLVPALRGTRRDLAASVREGTRGAGVARRRYRTQAVLVAAEVAASLVLLVGAGLFLRSFQRLSDVDPGVEPAGVAAMLVAVSPTKYADAERQRAVFARITERVAALPGAHAVGLCDCRPPAYGRTAGAMRVEGGATSIAEMPNAFQLAADGGYFAALRIPVLAGRAFTSADRAGSLPVVVVNRTFARRHLGAAADGAAAVGRRVAFGDTVWHRVVGVVADVHYNGLAAPVDPTVYYPFAQWPAPGMEMFLRTTGDPLRLVPAIRRAVLEVDSELPISRVAALEADVAKSIAGERFNTAILGLFAAIAFALAAIGIYGVVAYGVTQRRHEMGVRIALGAQRRDVVRLVVGRALRPVAGGVIVGLGAAIATTRVVRGLLYGTSPHDPATYAAVAALLTGVAALAAYAPSRRAAAADPVAALRAE
ncbi:MAG: ADOP family duplicated permease [Gemmatimonadaceae bacterium]